MPISNNRKPKQNFGIIKIMFNTPFFLLLNLNILNRCQGKTICQFVIDNRIYTDPCGPTIPKHFEVHYRCVNLDELFDKCSQTQDLKCIEQIQHDYSSSCPTSICQYNTQNQLIGFQQRTCSQEYFQGIHWPQTLANKGQQMPCPSPCTGMIC